MWISHLDTDAGLESVVSEWESLWRRVPDAAPFQSPCWLLAWWRHFGNGCPRVLLAREGDTLAGVLPLYELPEPQCRKLLPIGIGLSDYIDILVDPRVPAAVAALLGAVADLSGWDECHLPDLRPGSWLATAALPVSLTESRNRTVTSPVLALPSAAEGLARAVPRKTLRDLRQAAARSAAAGGVTIEAADPADTEPFVEDMFRLHEARWRARGEAGVCADPAVRGFHQAAARALGLAGLLRFYRLRIAGHIAAVYYGFSRGGYSYAYLGGFEPDLTRFSPGAQLLFHAIGEAVAEGCREFHMLRGGEAYKYAWGAADRWSTARTLRRR